MPCMCGGCESCLGPEDGAYEHGVRLLERGDVDCESCGTGNGWCEGPDGLSFVCACGQMVLSADRIIDLARDDAEQAYDDAVNDGVDALRDAELEAC